MEHKQKASQYSFGWMKTDAGSLETKNQVAVQRAIKKKKKGWGRKQAFSF